MAALEATRKRLVATVVMVTKLIATVVLVETLQLPAARVATPAARGSRVPEVLVAKRLLTPVTAALVAPVQPQKLVEMVVRVATPRLMAAKVDQVRLMVLTGR